MLSEEKILLYSLRILMLLFIYTKKFFVKFVLQHLLWKKSIHEKKFHQKTKPLNFYPPNIFLSMNH